MHFSGRRKDRYATKAYPQNGYKGVAGGNPLLGNQLRDAFRIVVDSSSGAASLQVSADPRP